MRIHLTAWLGIVAPLLHAGIVLDQDPLQLHPKPEDEEVESSFTFTNKSGRTVRITGLESSCTCLEASLDKAVYAPGEKGRGRARFKVSSFTGRQEKVLHIHTDDPEQPDTVLTAVIDIPVIVSVEPKLIQWTLGGKPEPRDFIIRMTGEEPIRITDVTSTRQSVQATFREVAPGREYRITVTPQSTADVVIGAVMIRTDSRIPKYRRQMAFYSIARPAATGEPAR